MDTKTSNQILNKIQYDYELPVIPSIAIQLLSLLQKKDNLDFEELASLIEKDPTLSAKLLKMANSAFYCGYTLSTIKEAISKLGFKQTSNIIISFSIIKSFPENNQLDYKRFWIHSLSVGLIAESINKHATNITTPIDFAYTAGLFHNIGMLALLDIVQDQYNEVLQRTNETNEELHLIEEQMLGTNNAEVGGFLLETWKFPSTLTNAILFQHEPHKAPTDANTLAEVINIANFIANTQGFDNGSGSFPTEFSPFIWDNLGLDPNKIPEIIEETQTDIHKAQKIFDISTN